MTVDNPAFPIRKRPVGLPPKGGGTGRVRSRYAPDAQVERAAKLAVELGLRLKLGADGSVEVLGRLDTTPGAAMADGGEGGDDADAYEAWKRKDRLARGK